MAQQYETKIKLTVDESGAVSKLKIVKDSVKAVADETNKAASSFSKAGSSMSRSAATFATAFLGVGGAIYAVANFMRDSIDAATAYQTKLMGVQIQAGNLGFTADEVKGAMQELTKDGMLSQKDALETLAYTFAGYVGSVNEAVQVINAFKDLAAVGGETTLTYSERVRGLAESYLTLMSRIGDKRGLAENWNRIIEVGEGVTKKRYEAEGLLGQRTILTAGILAVAQRAHGGLNAMIGTGIGTINQARTGVENLKLAVGNALMPAVVQLASAFNASSSAGVAFIFVIKAVGTALLGLVAFARMAATAIATVFSTAYQGITSGMDAALETWDKGRNELFNSAESLNQSLEDIWSGKGGIGWKDVFGDMNKGLLDMLNQVPAGAGKAARKAAEEIQKEMDDYARRVQKRDDDYMRSLADLIWAHQDKAKQLQKDLDEENQAYERANRDRLDDFNKTMEEMERRHLRKVRDFNQDLVDENDRYADRIYQIEEDIREEEKKGFWLYGVWNSAANQDRLNELRYRLSQEKIEHEKRLAELQQDMADELEDYTLASEEKTQTFQEETQAALVEHQKRVSALQTELNTETELLKTHVGLVGSIKDMQKEDDISRLVRQHAEEVAEDERSHQERIKAAIKAGQDAGGGYGGALKDSLFPILDETNKKIEEVAKNSAKNFGNEGKNAGSDWMRNFWTGLRDSINRLGDATSWLAGKIGLNLNWLKPGFAGFQHGGIVPGPIGAPVPAIVHGGERVVPRGGKELASSSTGGGGIAINIYGNMTVDSEERVKQLATMISNMLSREGELARYGAGY